MATAPLPRSDEADIALPLGSSMASAELPLTVDDSVPVVFEADGMGPFVPVHEAGFFPSSSIYPGEVSPGAPTVIDAPMVAEAPLPVAVDENDAAFTVTPLAVGVLPTAAEQNLALPLTSLVDDGEFGAAIDDADRVPIYSLKVDWNRNGLYDHDLSDLTDLVEQVTVNRVLSGTLPVEVGLVEGYSSAELSVTLSGTWGNTAELHTSRTNLALNPSFETSVNLYSVVNTGSLAESAQRSNVVAPPVGQYYLYIRPPANGTNGFAFVRCPLVAVTPGTAYTFSAYRNIVGTLSSSYVGVDWMDSSGTQIGGTTTSGPQITGAGWRRGSVTATAPAGAAFARQFLAAGTIDNTNYIRWDAVLAEVGNQLNDYFDGDSPGATWSGVPHASSSSTLVETEGDLDTEPLDLVDVFGPYRSDSPLFGVPTLKTPIYLDTGFITDDGPRLTRRFTGVITQIHPQSAARVVELRAIDPAALLRQSVDLPGVGMFADVLARRGPDAYSSRINSQWLIDYALRRNGIYTSPPARADAILSVTGHGSMIPEIGSGGAPEEVFGDYRGQRWVTGRFGGALRSIGGDRGRWWPSEQLTMASGTGIGVSMWTMTNSADGVERSLLEIDLTFDQSWFLNVGMGANGVPYVDAYSSAGSHRAVAAGFTPPTGITDTFFGAHVVFAATTMTVRFRVHGADYTQTVTTGNRGGNWRPVPYVAYNFNFWRFQNLQMWKSTTAPTGVWQGEDPNFIPQADLDPGNNEFTGLPALLGVDAWELIKQITDAEGSTFQFTEEGRPQFRTSAGDELYGRTKLVTERVTADRNLADLVSTTDETTVRNIINIKTKAQLIGQWQPYFKATTVDQFDTPPGTSIFDIPLDPDVYDIPQTRDAYGVNATLTSLDNASFVFYTKQEQWSEAENIQATRNYIRLALVYANNPVEITVPANVPAVYIRVERLRPTTMRIYITNYSAQTVRFATPSKADSNGILRAGEPGLVIPARLIEAQPEEIETYTDNASVATYGPSAFDVGGSDEIWRQTPTGLRPLATEVLATTANPVPVLDAVDVPHDPRRQLTNRIILADPQGLGEVAASIVGISTTYAPSGATDQLTVRPIAPPGLGVLDDDTHGLLDASLVIGP